jgi:hypothetical protein
MFLAIGKQPEQPMIVVEKLTIISGGQTGADRAALDWAIARGIPHGGWCPAGRLAEDGAIPERYALIELPGGGYRQRTRANVLEADATLIISLAPTLTGGSLATANFARRFGKPWLHVHPGEGWRECLAVWQQGVPIKTLNVAGPRASMEPRIATFVLEVLDAIIPGNSQCRSTATLTSSTEYGGRELCG